ncbi:MAG: sigma-70 family RNA polymerase sigma factor [Verrucomicrobia bacterium]|nr:sigma-70 family RNA polymerase sigma factor [Verrucomicrobiota bacterium]
MKNSESKSPTDTLPLDELTRRFPNVPARAAGAARLLFGNGREELVEEVVNHVLLLLWRRYQQGDLPANPEAWAYRVAWNRAAKVMRMEGRYVSGLVEQGDEPLAGYLLMPAEEVTPADEAELSDRLCAVKKLVDAFDAAARTHLSDKERLLFDLVYRKHIKGEQVAVELKLSPEAVRQQWSRLVTKLLAVARVELQRDPLCRELLGAVLDNETAYRRNVLQLLRLVMRRGVEELERLVRAAYSKSRDRDS